MAPQVFSRTYPPRLYLIPVTIRYAVQDLDCVNTHPPPKLETATEWYLHSFPLSLLTGQSRVQAGLWSLSAEYTSSGSFSNIVSHSTHRGRKTQGAISRVHIGAWTKYTQIPMAFINEMETMLPLYNPAIKREGQHMWESDLETNHQETE